MPSSVYCVISLFSIPDVSVLIDQLCTVCLQSLPIESAILPSSSPCSWLRRLLASSARLQPIKYVRHHPLITVSTLAGNRSEQAVTVDVKLTQIHEDELPFFTSPHQQRPINEPTSLPRIPSATCSAGLGSMSLTWLCLQQTFGDFMWVIYVRVFGVTQGHKVSPTQIIDAAASIKAVMHKLIVKF